MKKSSLLFLVLLFHFMSYSQISYEKGYFVNNENVKTTCLIKNIDWKNNPSSFQYKLQENSVAINIDITKVKEFRILNGDRFIRFIVKLDRSSETLASLKSNRNSVWVEETLFLKELVNGEAKLFSYEDGNLKKYFFSTQNESIQPLIHKYYLSPRGDKVTNNDYKQQLKTKISCSETTQKMVLNVEYKENDLVKYFVEYNNCVDPNYIVENRNKSKGKFNVTIKPGVNFTNLSISNESSRGLRDTDFGDNINFRFGVEFEYVMPFNKNKWSIFVEPTYNSLNNEKEFEAPGNFNSIIDQKANLDYKTIQFLLGLKHYMFINNKSKIFINAGYVLDFSFNSSIQFEVGEDLEIDSSPFVDLGFGYVYGNKLSLEVRFSLNQNLLSRHLYWSTQQSSTSIIIGYTLF